MSQINHIQLDKFEKIIQELFIDLYNINLFIFFSFFNLFIYLSKLLIWLFVYIGR